MQHKKLYIATKIENAAAHNALSAAFPDEWSLTYDWTEHGSVKHDRARMFEVSQAEMRGVAEADAVIALLPGGRGTHVEIGMAVALGVPVFIVGPGYTFGLGEETCAFYHHPGVTQLARGMTNEAIVATIRAAFDSGLSRSFSVFLDAFAKACHATSCAHGFWEGVDARGDHVPGEKIALIHSEASEALEEIRDGNFAMYENPNKPGKPEGMIVELADAVIRCGDYAAACELSLGDAVDAKMAYNRGRPYKHGRAF